MIKSNKPPTIKKISELAGVSRGTVDRVLNQRGGVNAETAERVRAIADKLRYKPNLVAKSLSAKGVNGARTIGVLVNSEGNPFFQDVLAGIKAKAAEIEDFGFNISLETLKGYNINEQLDGIDRLLDAGVSGIVLSPINRPPLAEKLAGLKDRGVPVVCLNTDVIGAPKLCYVGSDYRQCGRVAAGLFGLLAAGKPMKLAVVTGSFMILGHDLRFQGFKECIETEFQKLQIAAVVENNDNDELSYKVTREVLEKNPGVDGLFFSAAGVGGGLSAVEDAGLLEHIYVVSVDLIDVVRERLKSGGVTATICQEPYKQGYEAVRVMFEALLAEKRPACDIFTETQIIIKQNL